MEKILSFFTKWWMRKAIRRWKIIRVIQWLHWIIKSPLEWPNYLLYHFINVFHLFYQNRVVTSRLQFDWIVLSSELTWEQNKEPDDSIHDVLRAWSDTSPPRCSQSDPITGKRSLTTGVNSDFPFPSLVSPNKEFLKFLPAHFKQRPYRIHGWTLTELTCQPDWLMPSKLISVELMKVHRFMYHDNRDLFHYDWGLSVEAHISKGRTVNSIWIDYNCIRAQISSHIGKKRGSISHFASCRLYP